MLRQMDPTAAGGAKVWQARVRAAGLATAVALMLSPLAMPVADPAVVLADQVPDPCDFMTSGGYVMVTDPVANTTHKANFGAHGGCKNGNFWGHLNYVDHSTGYHVNSIEVTAYFAPNGVDSPVRDICGIASTNNPLDPEQVYFRARLIDNGEPGSPVKDQFGLQLDTGYFVDARVLGALKPGAGNVQLHDPNPSTLVAPADPGACGGLTFGNPPE